VVAKVVPVGASETLRRGVRATLSEGCRQGCSLDNLADAGEDRRRHRETERLGGVQIDDQLSSPAAPAERPLVLAFKAFEQQQGLAADGSEPPHLFIEPSQREPETLGSGAIGQPERLDASP
jgi:hypothetical protein